jgi:hypothetical protein
MSAAGFPTIVTDRLILRPWRDSDRAPSAVPQSSK